MHYIFINTGQSRYQLNNSVKREYNTRSKNLGKNTYVVICSKYTVPSFLGTVFLEQITTQIFFS